MSDVKSWIAKLAPMLGTALGGPFGAVAGELVSKALGAKDATPDSIQAAISAGTLTGDQIVALKKAEEAFQVQMQAAGFKDVETLQSLEFSDRASARNMRIQTKDSTPQILAYITTTGFFGILAWVLWQGFPTTSETAKTIVTMLIGALGHAWAQNVMGYYFGGSSDANKQIDKLTGGQP